MGKIRSKITAYEVSKTYYDLPSARSFGKVRELLIKKYKDCQEEVPSENHLSQMKREYENDGFIKHIVLPDQSGLTPQYLALLPEAEDELRQRFGLRDVVVVDASVLRRSPTAAGWQPKDDDLLHEHLGRWAGRLLASLLRPDDIVGTGGGRGPYYTVQFCAMPISHTFSHSTSQGPRASRAVSLTGFISAGMWHENQDPQTGRLDEFVQKSVDADHIASRLRHTLPTKLKPRILDCNIASNHSSPRTLDVTVAVVGIGALGGGHSLRRTRHFEDLGKAKKLVEGLNEKVREVEHLLREKGAFFHCVGDICNSYFVLKEVKTIIGPSLFNDLQARVDAVNDAFVNTSLKALSEISRKGAVLAVAGGPHKIGAIADVLKNDRKKMPLITHLVTDDEVARRLCDSQR